MSRKNDTKYLERRDLRDRLNVTQFRYEKAMASQASEMDRHLIRSERDLAKAAYDRSILEMYHKDTGTT